MVLQRRKKAACKSRPGHLVSSAWCLWIVHECGFRLQAKNGFQYLCQYSRFSKIQSHMFYIRTNLRMLQYSNVECNIQMFILCNKMMYFGDFVVLVCYISSVFTYIYHLINMNSLWFSYKNYILCMHAKAFRFMH